MRTTGACIAALLLLVVGTSAVHQENPVHVIDPWAPGIKCAFRCLRSMALMSRVRKEARRSLVQLLYQLSSHLSAPPGLEGL